MATPLPYLSGYSPQLQAQARELLAAGELGARIAARYPDAHEVRSNKALNPYVQELKARRMRTAPPLGQVLFGDSDPEIRAHAVVKLAEIRTEANRALLESATQDSDPKVRAIAEDLLLSWD